MSEKKVEYFLNKQKDSFVILIDGDILLKIAPAHDKNHWNIVVSTDPLFKRTSKALHKKVTDNVFLGATDKIPLREQTIAASILFTQSLSNIFNK